jgi:transcriptional regulator with XRE-family HTH domain
MNSGHYGRIESGKVDPQVSTLQRMAAGLSVSLADLLRGVD